MNLIHVSKTASLALLLAFGLVGCEGRDYADSDSGYTVHHDNGGSFWSSLFGAGFGSYVGSRLANHHSYGGGYGGYYHPAYHPMYIRHTTINHYHFHR